MGKDAVSANDRRIYLYGEIGSYSVKQVQEKIIEINYTDDVSQRNSEAKGDTYIREPIHLYIDSIGGEMYSKFGLIDVIQSSKTPVFTYNNGICSSAGFAILISGHRRYGRKHTVYMYHQANWELAGEYQKLRENVEFFSKLQKLGEEFTLSKNKFTQEFIDNIRERKIDYYFFSEEALELGVIDEII